MFQWMIQFIKFGITGFASTVCTYLLYSIFWRITNPTIGMALGYGIVSIISLGINQHWVFNTKHRIKTTIIKYYTTYGFSWLLSVLISNLASHQGVNGNIIPIISLIVTVPINFLLSKFWVFNNSIHKNKKGGIHKWSNN